MTEPVSEPREAARADDSLVERAPIEQGRDPLGDNNQQYRRKGQPIIGYVLGALFAVFAVTDFVKGDVMRGALAAVVALLNAYIAAKEKAKPKRPQGR